MLTPDQMTAQCQATHPDLTPDQLALLVGDCLADQERNAREPWRALQFDRTTEARGRNGWFVLDHGGVLVSDHNSWLELWGKRQGDNAPITLRFASPADMQRLGTMLTRAAQHWEAQREPGQGAMEDAYRMAAMEQVQSDTIQVDSDARVSLAETGAWVQAWVRVGDGETASEKEDDRVEAQAL